MKKQFLIQTISGEIVHDFTFTLIEMIKYHNWYYIDDQINYVKCEIQDIDSRYKDFCPIGSVEFVHLFYKKLYNIDNIKPINVPNELMTSFFCGRIINNYDINNITKENLLSDFGTISNFNNSSVLFVKSNDEIKFAQNGLYKVKDLNTLTGNSFQISNTIDILSEYRCFIFKNKLIGLHFYIGDFTIFPDIDKIKKMISAYKTAPISYTLDIGVTNNMETIVIECHNFYSCGLYGFNDVQLPLMHWLWHIKFLEKNNKYENYSN